MKTRKDFAYSCDRHVLNVSEEEAHVDVSVDEALAVKVILFCFGEQNYFFVVCVYEAEIEHDVHQELVHDRVFVVLVVPLVCEYVR